MVFLPLKNPGKHYLLGLLALFFYFTEIVDCRGVFVEERTCGALHSGSISEERVFIFQDFDQSVNLRRDYRTSNDGWENTSSIHVQDNCTMTVCSGPYFLGECQSLGQGDHHPNASLLSANCTCSRECSCDDIVIPKNDQICGRAYVNDDCDSCDSEYFQLYVHGYVQYFPNEYRHSHIQTLKLRHGCKFQLYQKDSYNTPTRVFQNKTTIREIDVGENENLYKCSCDNDAYVSQILLNSSYPVSIDLPLTEKELIVFAYSNESLTNHPGIEAAVESASNQRSSRNAYILAIGTNESSHVLGGEMQSSDTIGEYYKSVSLDNLGISNAQIRQVYSGVPANPDNDKVDKWIKSLEDYLSRHEELHSTIPNAVVIYHDNISDPTIGEEGSPFQRKLQALDSLRARILDGKHTNVIFLLNGMTQRNPEESLETFEMAINNGTWRFPKPTVLIPKAHFHHRVNGFEKLVDEEYFPMNFQQKLIQACQNGGDPLGRAVFKAAFPEEQSMMVMHRRGTKKGRVVEWNAKGWVPPRPLNMTGPFENLRNGMTVDGSVGRYDSSGSVEDYYDDYSTSSSPQPSTTTEESTSLPPPTTGPRTSDH